MTVETAADSGALSIDALVARMDKEEEPNPAAADSQEKAADGATPAEGETTEHTEADPNASGAEGAETQTEGDEGDKTGDEVEGAEPDPQPIEAPKFWDAKAKDAFAKLPREVQEIVLAKENERTAYTSRQAQEAAEKRKLADDELAKYNQLTAGLPSLLDRLNATLKSRWDNVDWTRVVDEYGADNALKLRAQYDAEMRQLQDAQNAQRQSAQLAQVKFRNERAEAFKTVCPDLADSKLGAQRQDELVRFIGTTGIDPQWAINSASAAMLALAYDAMQWRNGKAKAETLAKNPAPTAPKKTNPVKTGAASRPAASPQQARIKQLQSKRSLTIDEAVELDILKDQSQ